MFSANWAALRRANAAGSERGAPTEGNSDSDCSDSEHGEAAAVVSPVSRHLLASIVVFGADGDLASKKILPTLFQLWRRKLLPRDVLIFGFARAELSREGFRKLVFKCIYNPTQPQSERKGFLELVHYQQGQFNDPVAMAALYALVTSEEEKRIAERRGGREREQARSSTSGACSPPRLGRHGPSDPSTPDAPAVGNVGDQPLQQQVRLFYMAVPPFLYADICRSLRVNGAARADVSACGTVHTIERFVLEKPFGRDTQSCAQMVSQLSMLREDEVFRIDHYLGKELVMNLLVLRFANVAFQALRPATTRNLALTAACSV